MKVSQIIPHLIELLVNQSTVLWSRDCSFFAKQVEWCTDVFISHIFGFVVFYGCCFTIMEALTMNVGALTMDDNTKIATYYSIVRPTPPNDALDIKDCGCYTTIRKDLIDMNDMTLIYSKIYYLCTRHFLKI